VTLRRSALAQWLGAGLEGSDSKFSMPGKFEMSGRCWGWCATSTTDTVTRGAEACNHPIHSSMGEVLLSSLAQLPLRLRSIDVRLANHVMPAPVLG